MLPESGAGAGGEHRLSCKRKKQRGETQTPRGEQTAQKDASDGTPKKNRVKSKSRPTENFIPVVRKRKQNAKDADEAEFFTGGLAPEQSKQQLSRAQKHQPNPQQQGLKEEQQPEAQQGGGQQERPFSVKKARKTSVCCSSPLRSADSSSASSRSLAPRKSRRHASHSAGVTSKSDDLQSGRGGPGAGAANLPGSEAETGAAAVAQSEGGRDVSLKDARNCAKGKRERRDCWDSATVAEQKARLLRQLKDTEAREKLSKSRLKRLKARLSLLAKAERGEVQVGGQLLPSEKRRKLLEKVKRKKEEREKVGVRGAAEKRKVGKFRGKARGKSRREHDGDPNGAPAKKRIKKICLNCRKRGHLLENCPARTFCDASDKDDCTLNGTPRAALRPALSGICFNCGSKEHTLKNCKKLRKADGTLPFALCFVCGKGGHISSQCPDSKTGKYPKGGCCRTCGSIFHLQADCPELKNQKATNTAAGRETSHAESADTASRGRKQWRSAAPPVTKSHHTDLQVDPDEYW